MTDELDQLRERTRQNRAALTDEPRRAESPTGPAPGGTGRPLVNGMRVLDRVTGQEGVVELAASVGSGEGRLIALRLPGGGMLLRPIKQLSVM